MTILIELNDITNLNNTTAVTQLNQNSETIEGGFTTALNVTGDQMQGTLDMNSNQIINLPIPATANSPARLQDISTLAGGGTVTNIPSGGASGNVLTKSGTTPYTATWGSLTISGATYTAGQGITLSASAFSITNTGTATGSFGAAASVPVLTINAQGQITSATTVAAAGGGSLSSGTFGATGTTVQVVVSGGVITSLTSVSIGIAGSQVISGTISGSVIASASLGAGNVNGGVTGTLPASNMVLTDITTLSNLASLGTITTGTWNNSTGSITIATGNVTTVTTQILKSTSSILTPDGGNWTASGFVNATGNIYNLSSSAGIVATIVTGAVGGFTAQGFGNSPTNLFQGAGGTYSSPTAIAAAQGIGSFIFQGYQGSAYSATKARIQVFSTESGNWTSGAQGCGFEFDTTASGTTNRVQALRVVNGVIIGSGTTDPGAGIYISTAYTVTSLPAGVTGARAFVTDATATAYMSTVTGGSTNIVPVFYNGTHWVIA
jgi:hypothetical protein